MGQKKKVHSKIKGDLHPRNKHRERYDFKALTADCPELAPFVSLNKFKNESINFADPAAVLMLNKAILKHFYAVDWSIPKGFLCPPVPGRADYIHYVADLLATVNGGSIPTTEKVKCLDIGVGANCIYPIIGHQEYTWSFVGADIEPAALSSASKIVEDNPSLKKGIELRLQANAYDFFKGIIKEDEHYDVTICNPPFHSSLEEATEGSLRKLSSLNKKEVKELVLNFGGNAKELYCNGGEERFVSNMIKQSKMFADSCLWFTTLVSKQDNLRTFRKLLKGLGAAEVKMIPMAQGTKISRVIAWTFQNEAQQQAWADRYWK